MDRCEFWKSSRPAISLTRFHSFSKNFCSTSNQPIEFKFNWSINHTNLFIQWKFHADRIIPKGRKRVSKTTDSSIRRRRDSGADFFSFASRQPTVAVEICKQVSKSVRAAWAGAAAGGESWPLPKGWKSVHLLGVQSAASSCASTYFSPSDRFTCSTQFRRIPFPRNTLRPLKRVQHSSVHLIRIELRVIWFAILRSSPVTFVSSLIHSCQHFIHSHLIMVNHFKSNLIHFSSIFFDFLSEFHVFLFERCRHLFATRAAVIYRITSSYSAFDSSWNPLQLCFWGQCEQAKHSNRKRRESGHPEWLFPPPTAVFRNSRPNYLSD